MRSFAFHRSQSVADAIAHHGENEDVAYLAGGTTLIDLVKLDVMQPREMVDINRVPLGGIELLPDGSTRVGAMVRNSELAWDAGIKQRYPVLSAAILAGASPQLRNMATTAGNVMQRTRCPYFRDNVSACNKRAPGSGCAAMNGYNRGHAVLGTSEACIATHPSDMCVALAALDAELTFNGPLGERRMPMREFHLPPGTTPHLEHDLRPGELITAVILPPPSTGARSRYLKLRDRESYEFALVSVAVVLRLDGDTVRDVRLALGGVGTKPWRATRAEDQLQGGTASRANFEAAAEAALVEAQPRQHNAFKIDLARRAIVRALEDARTAGV